MWTPPKTWAVGEVLTAADLNEQLRDNIKSVHDSAHGVASEATGAGAGYVPFNIDTVSWEDWAGALTVASPNILPDGVGRYRITAEIDWSGQSGGVAWSAGRITWYDPGATPRQHAHGGMYALNFGFPVVMIADVADGADFFTVQASSAAGAAGGTATARITIEKLG